MGQLGPTWRSWLSHLAELRKGKIGVGQPSLIQTLVQCLPGAMHLSCHNCEPFTSHTTAQGFSVAIRVRSSLETPALIHHGPSFQTHFPSSYWQLMFTKPTSFLLLAQPSLCCFPVLSISSRVTPHWLNQKPILSSCPPIPYTVSLSMTPFRAHPGWGATRVSGASVSPLPGTWEDQNTQGMNEWTSETTNTK